MYKRAVAILVFAEVLFGAIFCGMMYINREQNFMEKCIFEVEIEQVIFADEKECMVEISKVMSSSPRVLTYAVMDKHIDAPIEVLQEVETIVLSSQDYENLLRIVEAEAGGEDEIGKILVANVVLNRVKCDSFPNSVTEVIFQKNNGVSQFSPVSNGRFYQVTVSEETKTAVEKALHGEDYSEGALYFAARKYADSKNMEWFDECLIFLFEHGGHEFFTQ